MDTKAQRMNCVIYQQNAESQQPHHIPQSAQYAIFKFPFTFRAHVLQQMKNACF